MKKAKLNRSEKVKKECLTILFLKDDDIDLWPWNFGHELSSASIKNRVKNAISNAEFEKVNCDDQFARESHSVVIPFNIAIREINNITLTASGKGSLSSKKRKNDESSSTDNDSDSDNDSNIKSDKENRKKGNNNDAICDASQSKSDRLRCIVLVTNINQLSLLYTFQNYKRIKRGRKPDFTLVSRELDGIPKFEYLIGEIMKDSHDLICKHFYKKYGSHKCQELDLWLVKILDIPVKKNTNVEEYNEYLNRLMIKNPKKNNSNEKVLISSLPPTARTPPR
ncbi:16282_t:CDS:2 [Gigaspora rosea]|nr:16282_t:CDS:2 [Gigaspora rosea]